MSNKKEIQVLKRLLDDFSRDKNFYNTPIAINLAIELHKGQERKSGGAFVEHPLKVACTLAALGIDDDFTIATAVLHDVLEDCNVTKEQLINDYHIHPQVAVNVEFLTKTKDMSMKKYYKELSSNYPCLLVKIADRYHNISSMVNAFSLEKIESYIEETKKYIIPLCNFGEKNYPKYKNQILKLKCHIESTCAKMNSYVHVSKQNLKMPNINECRAI